jgi:hypothetical protein
MFRCAGCKTHKAAESFSKNASRPCGLSHMCKACVSARNKRLGADHAKHYAKNSTYYKIKATFRKKSVKQATPKWLSAEDKNKIISIYLHARDCQVVTGEPYHVDHIIPLQGESVCGLHVPWNLCVLPAEVNIRKSNKTCLESFSIKVLN